MGLVAWLPDRNKQNPEDKHKEDAFTFENRFNFTTITELKKRGYKGAEIGVVDENNIASQKIIEKTGAKPHKTYRIYQKNINI